MSNHFGHLWVKDFDDKTSCAFCRARPGDRRGCFRVALTDLVIELWRVVVIRLRRLLRCLGLALRYLWPRCWVPAAVGWSLLWFAAGLCA
jgi:hypothetical protein